MKRKLTPQQRAQRYLAGRLPDDVNPYYVEAAYLAGLKAGQREGRSRVIDTYREHYAAAQRLLAQLTDENAELRAKLGRDA